MIITPVNSVDSHKTGSLRNMTPEKISEILGFPPNCLDDPCKVVNSWGGQTEDGTLIAIWDYKGSHQFGYFSTFGPPHIFKELFGFNYSPGW